MRHRTPEAQAAALHPALVDLPPEDVTAGAIALFRAEVLLDRGRRAEAQHLLVGLREHPASAVDGWLLTARSRRRAGDLAGAREAVAQAIRRAPVPELTIDRVADDPELGDALPDDVVGTPTVRATP
jgi:predicted Zn-dependent protease